MECHSHHPRETTVKEKEEEKPEEKEPEKKPVPSLVL